MSKEKMRRLLAEGFIFRPATELLMKIKNHLAAFAFLVNMCLVTSLQAQQTKLKQEDTVLAIATSPTLPEDRNLIFERTEVAANVDMAEWRKHLEKQLVPVIQTAAVAGIKPGKYIINVRFIVEKDGSITEVRALNDVGYGLALGAMNVVSTGPKWKPAMQNKRKVRSYQTQPITFVITDK
jgi:hypothetical protein